jgi:hypothetical protein
VAWRFKAKGISLGSMPKPLSVTVILRKPLSIKSTFITLAFASILFSTNSLTTLLGRSTTSPAAIILASSGLNSLILVIYSTSPLGWKAKPTHQSDANRRHRVP